MKARSFRYQRAASTAEAFAAFGDAGGDAVYIAGGQSLIPALALRLQAPELLIDIAHIADLGGVTIREGVLRIGALTRHADMIDSELIRRHAPLLSEAAPHVAHPAIRNRGTIGGSAAHADPAAEFPAVLLALRARFEILGAEGVRHVDADDFFLDLFETALAPGEILMAVLIPCAAPDDRHGFDELAQRRGDFGLVGCAVRLAIANGRVSEAGVALHSVGPKPMRANKAEAALVGAALDDQTISRAQAALDDDIDPPDDDRAPAEMRRHLARVLLGRILARLRSPS